MADNWTFSSSAWHEESQNEPSNTNVDLREFRSSHNEFPYVITDMRCMPHDSQKQA